MDYTIYISGKVTGEDWESCKNKFQKVEDNLREIGLKHIINPMKLGISEKTPWVDAMKICLNALEKCSAIFLLSDWIESKGAKEEFKLSALREMDTFFEDMNGYNELKMLIGIGEKIINKYGK